MGIREKLRERVAPYVREGEQIQQVMPAMSGISPYLLMTGGAIWALLSKPKIVVVTDQRILLLRASKLTGTKPLELLTEVPRSTRLGPMKGLWGKSIVAGQTIYFHKRFHKDVESADAAASAAA